MTATIQLVPPAPESSRTFYEVFCSQCRTHAGWGETANDSDLVEARDAHNRMHERLNDSDVRP